MWAALNLTPNLLPTNRRHRPMQNVHARAHPDADTDDLTTYGGIHAGRVSAWADALGCTTEAVVNATADVPPLMDTAATKARESHTRPTAPHLRCIAWNAADVERVRAVVG